MTKDEKTYIRWYEGKTFKNRAYHDDRLYMLADTGDGMVNIEWSSSLPNDGEVKLIHSLNLSRALDYIRDGRWVLND